jgi:hypothetical protein
MKLADDRQPIQLPEAIVKHVIDGLVALGSPELHSYVIPDTTSSEDAGRLLVGAEHGIFVATYTWRTG